MSTFINPFKPRGGAGYAQALSQIKSWTREVISHDEPTISVTELACAEPGCPPRETVILVFWPEAGASKLRIHKSMTDVTYDDVSGAFQAAEPVKMAT
jgi:hypothetical protein